MFYEGLLIFPEALASGNQGAKSQVTCPGSFAQVASCKTPEISSELSGETAVPQRMFWKAKGKKSDALVTSYSADWDTVIS